MPILSTNYEEHLVKSDYLGEMVSTRLYLPPDYSPLYTYPLIIAQDGQDYFNLGRIGTLLTQLIEDGAIEKVVVCGVPYSDVKTRWNRYHPDGSDQLDYLHFLHRELLPSLQKDYAIETLASGVTLLGDSLGGTVSLQAALTYPHAFGNVIMQSPFINNDILGRCKELPPSLRLYHSIGKNESSVKTTFGKTDDFLSPNLDLKTLLSQQTLSNYVFEENEGNHTWEYWQQDLEKALLHFYTID